MGVLEKFYAHAPMWMQNIGISLYGLSYRRERLGGQFRSYLEGFQERDSWTKARMDEYVERELQALLVRCYEEVPYYREAWSRHGLTRGDLAAMTVSRLAELPPTTKSDFRRAPERFECARGQRLRRYRSSGSTGTPITCSFSDDVHRRLVAAREARSFGWAGASIRMARSMLGGRRVVPRADAPPPYYRYNRAERQVYFSAYHIRPSSVQNYVEGFNRYRPLVATGYAASHYLLAKLMLDQGLSLDYAPAALVLSSEKLLPSMKPALARAFHTRAFEEYGSVENCALATECEQGNLHVSPDFGVVEIVDGRGRPVGPGETGRILCTGLLNDVQPLVRYEIGDLGEWAAVDCACGRSHLPVLREVVGRIEDVITGPDGRQMVRFHGVFVGMDNVHEGQVVQEQLDLIRVRVVAGEGFGARDIDEISRRVMSQLGRVRVFVEKTTELERTKQGKLKAVVSRVPESLRTAVLATR